MLQYVAKQYQMQEETLGNYQTYAVLLMHQGDIAEMIMDVSTQETVARRIAAVLTAQQVSPLHFHEVVADMVAQESFAGD